MKTLICIAALAAFPILAQDTGAVMSQRTKDVAKADVPKASPVKATEHLFSREESLEFRLLTAQVTIVQDKYHFADYLKEVNPLLVEGQNITLKMCKDLGASEADIQQGVCKIETGYNPDGTVHTASDGKPLTARVWLEKPVAPAPAQPPSSPTTGTK